MKKYDKEQSFRFEIHFEVCTKDVDYGVAMKKTLCEVNKLNNGEARVNGMLGRELAVISDDNSEGLFVFEIKVDFFVKSRDYDAAMMKVMDEVSKLNIGDVVIREICSSHNVISL